MSKTTIINTIAAAVGVLAAFAINEKVGMSTWIKV